MTTLAKQARHPYITTDKKIRGGEPVISGTGIRVMDIAVRYEIMRMTPEEIVVSLPRLNLSQVHDALSYYYDHKNEVDKAWKEAVKKAEALRKSHPSILEKKVGTIKNGVQLQFTQGVKFRILCGGLEFVNLAVSRLNTFRL